MRIQFIHLNLEDFNSCAAGTMELMRRKLKRKFESQLILAMDPDAVLPHSGKHLKYPNGNDPESGSFDVNPPLIAAIWQCIRDFQPDVLICPYLPEQPPPEHRSERQIVADAVRRATHLLNVPQAFMMEFPAGIQGMEFMKKPVILSTCETAEAETADWDLAIDVSSALEAIDSDSSAKSKLSSDGTFELLKLTSWGEYPRLKELMKALPEPNEEHSRLQQLKQKIQLLRD